MGRADAAELYERLSASVLGYLRSTGATDPEGCLGDTFLQVAHDLGAFPDAGDPDAERRWVFTIARNRMLDAARRERRRPRVSGDAVPDRSTEAEDVGGPDPELVAALARLTDDQREVLALRFVADLPLEAVAHMTGRSTGAVKALQHRALEELRRALTVATP